MRNQKNFYFQPLDSIRSDGSEFLVVQTTKRTKSFFLSKESKTRSETFNTFISYTQKNKNKNALWNWKSNQASQGSQATYVHIRSYLSRAFGTSVRNERSERLTIIFFSTTTERRANRAAMRGDYQAAAYHQNRADNLRFKANVGRRMYRRGMGVGRPVVVAPRVVRRPVVVRRAPRVVAPVYGAPVYHAPGYQRGYY